MIIDMSRPGDKRDRPEDGFQAIDPRRRKEDDEMFIDSYLAYQIGEGISPGRIPQDLLESIKEDEVFGVKLQELEPWMMRESRPGPWRRPIPEVELTAEEFSLIAGGYVPIVKLSDREYFISIDALGNIVKIPKELRFPKKYDWESLWGIQYDH